jgi:hypothetical protein
MSLKASTTALETRRLMSALRLGDFETVSFEVETESLDYLQTLRADDVRGGGGSSLAGFEF